VAKKTVKKEGVIMKMFKMAFGKGKEESRLAAMTGMMMVRSATVFVAMKDLR